MVRGSISLGKYLQKEASSGVSVRHGGALDLNLKENVLERSMQAMERDCQIPSLPPTA